MEQENRRLVTWSWIIETVKQKFDPELKYYGIPRGGQYIAALLNPVDTPEEADILIDDIIDSGKTKKDWETKYPNKPFVALFDDTNREPGEWIVFPWEDKSDIDIEDHVRRIIQYFDDANREGLKDTPKRYIKFLTEFLNTPEFNFTVFDAEGTDEMIVQTNIPFYSLCEHHLAPFFGYAHVAYIPNEKIVGLSKLSRTVDLYANRFQNQERITTQVAERLQKELNAKGVAVVLTAQHMCMSMRGVMKHDTWTTTSKMIGEFHDDLNTRQEFLEFIRK